MNSVEEGSKEMKPGGMLVQRRENGFAVLMMILVVLCSRSRSFMVLISISLLSLARSLLVIFRFIICNFRFFSPSSVSALHNDGKKCVAKELVEEIDEEKKSVRFKIIEGDLLKEFKSLTISVHVIPRGEITAVKWTAEFEKIADDGPYPTKIIDFCIDITKDIEDHHLTNNATA